MGLDPGMTETGAFSQSFAHAPTQKGPRRCRGPFCVMVGVRGFEPPAPASRRQCSTRLSYTPIPWTAPLGDLVSRPPRRGVGGYIPARPAPRKRRIPPFVDFLKLPVDHEIDDIQQRRLLFALG